MRAAVLVLLLAAAAATAPTATPIQNQNAALRAIGLANRGLTPADLSQISQLVSPRGQAWLAFANWPTREQDGWLWSVEVYLFPETPKGDVVRGKVAIVTTKLPGPNTFDARKEWQLSESTLAFAVMPVGGQIGFWIASDRDPRRPFITKPSDTLGQISDADLLSVLAVVRAGPYGGWAITEMALVTQNIVALETVDPNPSRNTGASVIVQRDNAKWTVMNTLERQLPTHVSLPSATAATASRGSVLPAMVVAVLAAGLNVFGLWGVFSAWKSGRGSPHFILGLLPIALMCLVAPIPAVILQMITSFRTFAPSGGNIAATLAISERAFMIGAFGFVLSTTAAAALQWHAGWVDTPLASDDTPVNRSTGWQATVLMLSPLIAVPGIILVRLVERLPRTIVEQAMAALQSAGASSSADLQQLSAKISGWLILSFAGGVIGAIVVAVVGVMTLILVRSNRFSARMATYSWAVLAVVGVAGVWNAALVLMDLRWLIASAAKPLM